jgi:hypothetical protein
MKKSVYFLVPVVLATLVGCATSPEDIRATSVSPLRYSSHNCDQIIQEAAYVEEEVNALYHNLKKKADNDAAQMGAGIFLWPFLLGLEGGDGPEAADYARFKGEHRALRTAAISKSCATKISPLPTPEEAAEDMKKAEESISN